MNLFDKSFWVFVTSTGRVPKLPDSMRLGDDSLPLCIKALTVPLFTPGCETVDPADIQAKWDAHALRRGALPPWMAPLGDVMLASDAITVSNSNLVPAQDAMLALLGGGVDYRG